MSNAETEHNQAQIAAFSERRERVLRLHREGWSFRRIADELQISRSRVGQIHSRGLELEEEHRATIPAEQVTLQTPIENLPLPTRTRRALGFAGYATLGQLLPLDEAKVGKLLRLPSLDRVGLRQLTALVATTNGSLDR